MDGSPFKTNTNGSNRLSKTVALAIYYNRNYYFVKRISLKSSVFILFLDSFFPNIKAFLPIGG